VLELLFCRPCDIGVKVRYKSVDLRCYYVGCLI